MAGTWGPSQEIGTGSFKAVEFKPSSIMRFEAWDGSWRGKSTIQTATIQQVPEAATLISALKTGQVDIIFQPPADQVAGLKRDGFNVASVNSSSCTICSLLPSHPVMRDKRVREAIDLAVNKEELLQTVRPDLARCRRGSCCSQASSVPATTSR